jgi:hypothetical protein
MIKKKDLKKILVHVVIEHLDLKFEISGFRRVVIEAVVLLGC